MPDPEPTAWAHLPNARRIDGIIADVQARPKAWGEIYVVTWAAAWETAWAAAKAVTPGTVLARIAWPDGDIMRTIGPLHALDSVRGTLLALLAWPDSARMLSMTPAALRTLIDITEGDVKHQAVLILPAVLAGYTGD